MDRDIYAKLVAKLKSLSSKINAIQNDGIQYLANGNYHQDGVAIANTTTTGYYIQCTLSRPAKDISYSVELTSVSLTGIASITAEEIALATLKEKTINSFIIECPSTRVTNFPYCTCHVGYTISGIT